MNRLFEILFLKRIKAIGKVKFYKTYYPELINGISFEELKNLVLAQEKKILPDDINKAEQDSQTAYQNIINRREINAITVFDADYPKALAAMGTKRPMVLYLKGNPEALKKPQISIIGTREPTEWSRKIEVRLVHRIINNYDCSILSGLALGCDALAHKVTLSEDKTTIAVLPSGFDYIYPAANKEIAESIIQKNGCLITEYEPSTKSQKSFFIERDAIVAALSKFIFVIECSVKSGTMHTVDYGKEYGRNIACYLPTSDNIGSEYAGNQYIKNQLNGYAISELDALLRFCDQAGIPRIGVQEKCYNIKLTELELTTLINLLNQSAMDDQVRQNLLNKFNSIK